MIRQVVEGMPDRIAACDLCHNWPKGLSSSESEECIQAWLDGESSYGMEVREADEVFHFTNSGKIYCLQCVDKIIEEMKKKDFA